MVDGLYEQVINKELETELSKNDKLSQTMPIDTAEASRVLAKYVAEVVVALQVGGHLVQPHLASHFEVEGMECGGELGA